MTTSTLIPRHFTADLMFYSHWTPAQCCWGGSSAEVGGEAAGESRGAAGEKIMGLGGGGAQRKRQFEGEFAAEWRIRGTKMFGSRERQP